MGLKELLESLHNRHRYVRERYGKTTSICTQIGEGVYIFANVLGTHEIEWFVYCGLGVVWVAHTIIIGFEE